MLRYIGWLLDYKFLGLCGGFYFVAIPFLLLIIYSEYLAAEKEKERKEELISRLPNEKIYVDISKKEKWMLNNLVNRSACKSEDKFLRQAIKEVINKEYDYV